MITIINTEHYYLEQFSVMEFLTKPCNHKSVSQKWAQSELKQDKLLMGSNILTATSYEIGQLQYQKGRSKYDDFQYGQKCSCGITCYFCMTLSPNKLQIWVTSYHSHGMSLINNKIHKMFSLSSKYELVRYTIHTGNMSGI